MGFTRPNPPCRGCDSRHEGCHSNCPKYKDWKNEYQNREAYIRKIYETEHTATDYMLTEISKNTRKQYR